MLTRVVSVRVAKLLISILENVVAHPLDEKFRCVLHWCQVVILSFVYQHASEISRVLKVHRWCSAEYLIDFSRLCEVDGAVDVLRSVGFTIDANTLFLAKVARLFCNQVFC